MGPFAQDSCSSYSDQELPGIFLFVVWFSPLPSTSLFLTHLVFESLLAARVEMGGGEPEEYLRVALILRPLGRVQMVVVQAAWRRLV